MHLQFIDFLIMAIYFVGILLIGVLFSRRAGKGIEEYFVSGRSLPWWIVGTSMVATTFAADTPNLVTNIVRNQGVSGNWLWWAFLLTGMVTVFFYAKLWRRSEALTDIGFYELRYSGKEASFLRGFRALYLGVIFNVIVMANVTLAAIKISGILLGLDKYTTILICGAITAIYSCTAGLWGVVITDILLFVIAMAGSIAAAYFALNHEAVGGLANLLANPAVQSHLSFLPDFSNWKNAMYVFLVPIAVQWWSVWYPGAEPGGGGYVAQRMLASKDEKNSLYATLWFNVAHYAIRPWPWILVALCSLVVFPQLSDIQQRFPNLDPGIIKDDLAYPAMLTFLPAGFLGLVVASLAAAYMSTISTHLNWGASYVIDDFYKRFLCKDGDSKHYVFMARVVTVLLMVVSCLLSFYLDSALQGFSILLQIGAGTGLIFMLRWFWWRINAWTEIAAMIISFLVAVYFHFIHSPVLGFAPFAEDESWIPLVSGVAITTCGWLLVTYLTPPTKQAVLQSYYDKIQPLGRGWAKVVQTGDAPKENITGNLLAVFLGCTAVYSALFATGYLIYGKPLLGGVLAILAIAAAVGVKKLLPQLQWRG
ncbi:MAG: sodium:solute symporter family protein [bacterium]|jgi:Na+/proline symporter|nr:sodium:solute symporter family protein [bacterium]